MSKLRFFIALFLSLFLIVPENAALASKASAQIPSKANNKQYSTWLWNTSQITTNPDKVLNFLSINNVNILYLQIDYNMNPGVYRNFIKQASLKNISIHALDGAPDWVADNGDSRQKVFFDWLINFQNTSAPNESFKGVHLDVEPYLNPVYNTNRRKVIENYQSFLLNAYNSCNSLNLSLTIDIPFWFDEVEYNTKYGVGTLAEWIMKNVKNVVIMAYRDSARGDNGIINLVSRELTLGKQYDNGVTIAVETQKSAEGNNITFYEEGARCINTELDKVYDNYKDNSSFAGFAIHDVINWMELK